MTTFAEAFSDMNQAIYVPWQAQAAAAAGSPDVPALRFDGVEVGELPLAHKAWGRVVIRHHAGTQKSLGKKGVGRKFERSGLLTVQCFGPIVNQQGLAIAHGLAIICRNAVEGVATPNSVWFRDVAIKEAGLNEPWYLVNMVASFNYDDYR